MGLKNINAKGSFLSLLVSSLVALLLLPYLVWAGGDLLDGGKSDSAIKMLVFPKSLRVIESRVNTQATLSGPKQVRKTLLKLDPTRVAPAKSGEPISGPVTRDRLRELSKQYSEDVIFIFRRTPEEHAVRYQGLFYLTRQKKVLALKGNEGRFSNLPEQKAERWKDLDESGLKTLAQEAKKVLRSHKFEKRQSAY